MDANKRNKLRLELHILDTKIHGLTNFINESPIYSELDIVDRGLLQAQRLFMIGYAAILDTRIEVSE